MTSLLVPFVNFKAFYSHTLFHSKENIVESQVTINEFRTQIFFVTSIQTVFCQYVDCNVTSFKFALLLWYIFIIGNDIEANWIFILLHDKLHTKIFIIN